MHFKQIFVALCLSSLALAKGDEGKDHKGMKNATKHEERQCAEITHLTHLILLANNDTKLAELETEHKLNATDIVKIKEKAANSTTKLSALQSNATLTAQCPIIDAHQKLKMECHEMKKLKKFSNLATNKTAQTEYQAKHNLTPDEMKKVQEKAQNATKKLEKMQKNSTLVSDCKTMEKKAGKDGSKGEISSGASGLQIAGNGLFALVLAGLAAVLMA